MTTLFICSVAQSLLQKDRSFRRLSNKLPKKLRQMLSIIEKEPPPRSLLHQKRDQRRIGLGRVTIAAGQNQVVGAVVRGLPAARPNMVQGDDVGRNLGPAINAYRAVLAHEPIAMRL